jgi:uncharacterized protein
MSFAVHPGAPSNHIRELQMKSSHQQRLNALFQGLILMLASALANAQSVFINEFHYDNVGTDAGEFIEIAGPAGTDLSTYSIELYNGANFQQYDNDLLAGTIPNQQNGFGTLSFAYPVNGIQNGAPDGIALVNGASVVQFLSYEGSFKASNGTAAGMTSTDIGVSENDVTSVTSLNLVGAGMTYDDFTWMVSAAATPGLVNVGQEFTAAAIPEPETYALLLAGLGLLGFVARRRKTLAY